MRSWTVRAATGGSVLILAVGLLALGTAAGQPRGETSPPSRAATASGAVPATVRLQQTVARLPGNYRAWSELGLAHLDTGRRTADPSAYTQAEAAFDKALALRPRDSEALAGSAALAAARHDFSGALRLADRALVANPYGGPAHAVRTDALVELGDYTAARAAAQRLLELQPGTAAFSRASYLLELDGDITGATRALQQARAAGALGADLAFVEHLLGQLAWQTGDLDGARRAYDAALRADPTHLPALAGRAQVLAARGDSTAAVAIYQQVVTRLPQPEHLTRLGELYESLGQPELAQQQYDVVRATQQLFAAAGADVDTELALFEADHGTPAAATAAAERTYRKRPDAIFAQDAYAWALHAAGRDREALPIARQALRLGTRQPLLHFHLGVLELAVGSPEAGRAALRTALELNPAFSPVHGPVARRLLTGR